MYVVIRTRDGDTVEYRLETEDRVYEGETTDAAEHEVDTAIVDFEQTGGDGDWVLEVDGEPVSFGGPGEALNDSFAYATRDQVRAFVSCVLEDYPDRTEVETMIAEAEPDVPGDVATMDDVAQVEAILESEIGAAEASIRQYVDAAVADVRSTVVEKLEGYVTPADVPQILVDRLTGREGESGWEPIDDEVWENRVRTDVPEGTGWLGIWAETSGANLDYRVEGVGRAGYFEHPDDGKLHGAPNNDDIDHAGEGFVIEGHTGNTYGDGFVIDGYVTAFEVTGGSSAWALESGGDVDPLRGYDGPTEGEN